MIGLFCKILGHTNRSYIKFNPDRLECARCGKVKIVHQNMERNQGNGHRNTNGFVRPSILESDDE